MVSPKSPSDRNQFDSSELSCQALYEPASNIVPCSDSELLNISKHFCLSVVSFTKPSTAVSRWVCRGYCWFLLNSPNFLRTKFPDVCSRSLDRVWIFHSDTLCKFVPIGLMISCEHGPTSSEPRSDGYPVNGGADARGVACKKPYSF